MTDQTLIALMRGHNRAWVHNAAITQDIEALRRIALTYSEWWNNTAWPAIVAAHDGNEDQATLAMFGFPPT